MPPFLMLPLKHHLPQRMHPRLRQQQQLPRESTHPDLHPRRIVPDPLQNRPFPIHRIPMRKRVVNSLRRVRPRTAERVDANPGENLVGGPLVVVRPVVQLLVDPGQEPDGRVRHAVADGLWFGGVFDHVAVADFVVPFCAGEAGFLGVGEGGQGRARGEGGEGAGRGFGWEGEVGVHRDAVVGVLGYEHPGDEAAEVTALADVGRVPEGEHQFVAVFGMLVDGEASFGTAGTEPVVDEGGGHDVEGGGVGGGVDE